jgi:hypothetical protein
VDDAAESRDALEAERRARRGEMRDKRRNERKEERRKAKAEPTAKPAKVGAGPLFRLLPCGAPCLIAGQLGVACALRLQSLRALVFYYSIEALLPGPPC